MKNIQGIKVGNVVNISIDGKLHKKNCGSPAEADELFKLVLKAKADPSDANIKAIRMYLNERTRVALLAGLESDMETGEVFLCGFNTPIPMTLVEVIREYHENQYPLDAIMNFWKLLMINPDVRIRLSLFDFIKTHDFVLTDNGYMIVYKAVAFQKKAESDLPAFISNQYLHVKKDWKCSPNRYVVYRKLTDIKDVHGELFITKIETAEGWDESKEGVEVLGKLGDLFMAIFNEEQSEPETVYTDKHSRSMSIVLGQPVKMERRNCDGDPAKDCSYGLHCGSTSYVNTFANNGDAVLVCLVSPANVVAVPESDNSKFRTTEYFPFAVASYSDGKIDIIEEKYFESDYIAYELAELEALVAKVRAEQLPIEAAINVQDEERPMAELLKILETRIFDLE